jgi:DNA helicase-2/ATP-dependent DNA helicase PcrA
MTAKAKTKNGAEGTDSGAQDAEGPAEPYIDNIARFFGGQQAARKSGGFGSRPAMNIPASTGAVKLAKGQRVRHSKYGEGTVLMREGEGEDAKLTVMFTRHGMKKLMEKFANLEKI